MPTVAITPALTGYASITNFLLSSDTKHSFGSSVSGTKWTIGDGTIAETSAYSLNKTYSIPGIYQVGLLNSDTVSSLTVYNYLPENINFEPISITAMPSVPVAVILNLTSNSVGPHDITLYSTNSNSFPYNEKGGLWTHLNPEWKFTDADGKVFNTIQISATPLYYNSTSGVTYNPDDILIGSTTQLTAYYVDDMPSQLSGVKIAATKLFGDVTNSKVSATTTFFISAGLPTKLNITSDGIQDMQPFYWQNSNILHTVRIANDYSNLKYLPTTNSAGIAVNRKFYADGVDVTSAVSMSSININAIAADNFTHIRGYLRDLAKTASTMSNVIISASASCTVNYSTLSATNFFTPLTGTVTTVLTGQSTVFDILTTTHNNFRRFNESENFTCLMKDFVNAPTFKTSTNFFDEYFGIIAGNEPVDEQALGQKIMEKIGNFATNHHDIDVANLDQFLSLAKQVDLDVDDYGLVFPERLKRIMDVATVDHKKVWGARCPCNQSFACSNCCGDLCSVCGQDKTNNLGDTLSSTATLSVGTPVVIKYIQRDPAKYELFYPKSIGALTAYSLSSLTAVNLQTPLSSYYQFYTYIPTPANNQVEGIINWSDSFTTIAESASSANDWYGDNQILDSIFNLELHKGLNLITE